MKTTYFLLTALLLSVLFSCSNPLNTTELESGSTEQKRAVKLKLAPLAPLEGSGVPAPLSSGSSPKIMPLIAESLEDSGIPAPLIEESLEDSGMPAPLSSGSSSQEVQGVTLVPLTNGDLRVGFNSPNRAVNYRYRILGTNHWWEPWNTVPSAFIMRMRTQGTQETIEIQFSYADLPWSSTHNTYVTYVGTIGSSGADLLKVATFYEDAYYQGRSFEVFVARKSVFDLPYKRFLISGIPFKSLSSMKVEKGFSIFLLPNATAGWGVQTKIGEHVPNWGNVYLPPSTFLNDYFTHFMVVLKPIPAYNGSRWMTDAYDDIKHLSLDDISLLASHNSLYSENGNGANFCYVQENHIKDQFDQGARYFDVRPYLSEHAVTRNGFMFAWKEFKHYVYGGFHGYFCSAVSYDLIGKIRDLKNALSGTKEIAILEFRKERYQPITKSTAQLATNFYGQLVNIFGDMIITQDELRSMGSSTQITDYTIEQLSSKGNVIFLRPSAHIQGNPSIARKFTTFNNFGGEDQKARWNVSRTYTDTSGYFSRINPYMLNQATQRGGLKYIDFNTETDVNLQSAAKTYNKYFSSKVDTWLNHNASWVHGTDYVNADGGWAKGIAEKFYKNAIRRGRGW